MIKLIIPMKIFPKKRPRTVINKTTGKRHTYTPRDDREANLETYMWEYMIKNKLKPFTTNLRVDCHFFIKSKARCDLDNAAKTVFDCGNGILWKDDKQIKVSWIAMWENWTRDSIEITIKEIKRLKKKKKS